MANSSDAQPPGPLQHPAPIRPAPRVAREIQALMDRPDL
jgi:hypothetical protein